MADKTFPLYCAYVSKMQEGCKMQKKFPVDMDVVVENKMPFRFGW